MNSNSLQKFSFTLTRTFIKDQFQITPIMMGGKPIFLPQEIEQQLGYTDLADSVRKSDSFQSGTDYEVLDGAELEQLKEILRRNVTPLQISPMARSLIVLTESGFYALAFRSNKPECKDLRIWVTDEVLPSIRKTGYYGVPNVVPPMPIGVSAVYDDMLALVETINRRAKLQLDDNMVMLKADKATQKLIGHSPLLLTDTELQTPVQERYLGATDIGLLLSPVLSAVAVNRAMRDLGYQAEERNQRGRIVWRLTDIGKTIGRYYDVGKQHSDGTPVQQIKWSAGAAVKLLSKNN
jgi:prophage antirepressor-like protein